jgi:hypothetical protein
MVSDNDRLKEETAALRERYTTIQQQVSKHAAMRAGSHAPARDGGGGGVALLSALPHSVTPHLVLRTPALCALPAVYRAAEGEVRLGSACAGARGGGGRAPLRCGRKRSRVACARRGNRQPQISGCGPARAAGSNKGACTKGPRQTTGVRAKSYRSTRVKLPPNHHHHHHHRGLQTELLAAAKERDARLLETKQFVQLRAMLQKKNAALADVRARLAKYVTLLQFLAEGVGPATHWCHVWRESMSPSTCHLCYHVASGYRPALVTLTWLPAHYTVSVRFCRACSPCAPLPFVSSPQVRAGLCCGWRRLSKQFFASLRHSRKSCGSTRQCR